ncbi:Holliday junction branch migration protein RuvA [Marinigracilibium pacificum]|uniref:Holliday junction branch migration complex subunit RuvA n=1 Tax=Marinigracilibium pacificum TaxID=2729599 RepID=A0A848IZ73_9BACT|nr:Holliday junction branch migration protein RuvA [Marinigracilibium pacificum]NMM48661.1 Holliday junction branch migration protein RuvA [Marinigracilibium pacificum]
MIAYIKGKLDYKDPAQVVIEAAGVGYRLLISLQTYEKIPDKENIKLLTYLHIKEDSHTLFGFAEESERVLFLHLISVSGVGPSTALMMLSSMHAAEIIDAVVSEDVKTIQSVKGIGAKTAQRLILELKDKLKKEALELAITENNGKSSVSGIRLEAVTALTTLGIAKSAAEKNIDLVLKKLGNTISLEELIRQALKIS